MKRLFPRWMVALLLAVCVIWTGLRLMPKPSLLSGVPFSPVVTDRQGELLRFGLATDDVYRQFVPLEKIAPVMVGGTLLYEDRYFYRHAGANPVALARAFRNEFSGSGRRLGASTITMQVARMRYHLNTRTWGGKLRQIAAAARLECLYSKSEILEAYFNLAPYGRNIEGVGAASRIYFGKNASELSLGEALTLSVIPQNPRRRAPGSADGRALNESRCVLFNEWIEQHPQDAGKRAFFEMAMQVSTLAQRTYLAPHFCEDCLRSLASNGPESREPLATTLDLGIQEILERQIARFSGERKSQGIDNACAVLIDYRTMEVLASVGSADFFNKEINGQVNGAQMRRSPGSALKPFVYALALDQGIIQPHTLLKDAPTSFNGYNPENFDRDFMGPVQACDALVQSRNIPAVYLASKLKAHSLYGLLQEAGVEGLREEKQYGLTIALGGVEVSPENLAALYAMLANRGLFNPLRKLESEAKIAPQRMLSPEAAFLVLDMLKQNNLPGYTGKRTAGTDAVNMRPVAWKTGTSYSFRDAWTAGVFDHYVLVVWVGSFDGHPNPALVGRSAAAPLFFSIIGNLRARESGDSTVASWELNAGLNLAEVDLCAVTGELAGAHCTHRRKGWFIPGVSPLTTCAVHREILIDAKTGYQVASPDAASEVRREIWEVWPSDLQALFRFAGLPRRTPPPFAPGKEGAVVTKENGPEILSPRSGMEYHLRLEGGEAKVPMQAHAEAAVRNVYWFVDKTYVGSTTPGETLFWPAKPGRYQVSAVDDVGHSTTRALVVATVE
jgi:penicillin-binding protein 1C